MSIMNFKRKSNPFFSREETHLSNKGEKITDEKDNINMDKSFDLNIEKILENWEVYHAIREIIANALDEQTITGTEDIKIYKSKDGCWHVVDYGRGLNYHHLTQNENVEKLNNEKLIGRFGVGLKDALATLYRHGINVKITSKFGVITLKQALKIGFDDIITLHAKISKTNNSNALGTDFCLEGCSDEDMEKAKSLFLKFSNNKILEQTINGQVIKNNNISYIYINGVKVAEESNFLFSYNITSLSTKLKRALNRERTNVGRTAYAERIKAILLECKSDIVINDLIDDLQQFGSGLKHDELNWQDIQLYASQQLKVLCANSTFITPEDLMQAPNIIDKMERSGYNPVIIPSNLVEKMEDYNKEVSDGEEFITTEQFVQNERSEFNPIIIHPNELAADEKIVYSKTAQILDLIGGLPQQVKKIRITENIFDSEIYFGTVGLWQPEKNRILIKRSQLCTIDKYAGTLLHECVHALSGFDDVSRDFESKLTDVIGTLVYKLIK